MKKILLLFVLFCIGCNRTSCPPSAEGIPPVGEIQDVSMIQLIANPEQFHLKKVRLIGFAVIEFEYTAIFFSKEFSEYSQNENGLWLDNFESKYDRKYVLVEGIFNKNEHGHFSMFPGTITQITRIEEWRKIE